MGPDQRRLVSVYFDAADLETIRERVPTTSTLHGWLLEGLVDFVEGRMFIPGARPLPPVRGVRREKISVSVPRDLANAAEQRVIGTNVAVILREVARQRVGLPVAFVSPDPAPVAIEVLVRPDQLQGLQDRVLAILDAPEEALVVGSVVLFPEQQRVLESRRGRQTAGDYLTTRLARQFPRVSVAAMASTRDIEQRLVAGLLDSEDVTRRRLLSQRGIDKIADTIARLDRGGRHLVVIRVADDEAWCATHAAVINCCAASGAIVDVREARLTWDGAARAQDAGHFYVGDLLVVLPRSD